ncbi:hypothetical protein BUALT_Bualt04G0004800 [Buddleja alternifolia]|uniref:AAA+ ATPase domain-containing protein n=1 Tax=Buddleja alternifolia TaxID=168488 RepID=A0AAV6XLI9_9LAMI|nr:hypothetical protein BUALT_Bualt04G0004800 [Buddleja alternifolia]
MDPFGQMPSMASNIFSAYASMAASMMLFRSMANDVVPESVKTFFITTFSHFFKHVFGRFFSKLSPNMTIVVDEQTGIMRNQIYDAAEIYLRTIINPETERLKVIKSSKQKNISLGMEKDHEVVDFFQGIKLKWQFVLIEPEDKSRFQPDKKYFELTFEKVNKDTVVNKYLPFVLSKADEIKANEKAVKLYTRDCPFDNDDDDGGNGGGYWGCINFDHPVTFEKLAMDPKLKRSIIEDLDRFVRRREYYKKVGKAWKRGYLLYGPPGTGKSSLIAAMANYLKFDVYDLELTSLYSNSELRRVLLCTTNRSILVIEDIDCSVQMHDREANSQPDTDSSKLTLSGLLNFIDGLWSTCGDERIVIFTTNHKEKLDPALLRPGRMDMHIHMGYCSPEGFDVLASNYLGIEDHPKLFPEIKGLIREVEITPAELAEHLMRNEDVDLALQGVIGLLKQKKNEKAVIVEDSECKEDKNDENEVEEKKRKGKFGRVVKSLRKFGSRGSMSKEKGEFEINLAWKMSSLGQMQSLTTNIFSAYASMAASMMLFRSLANDIIPESVKSFLQSLFSHIIKHLFGNFFNKLSTEMTIVVDEQIGIARNEIYDATETYLRTKINPDTERLKVNKTTKQKKINLSMEKDQQVIDFYKGIKLKWQFVLIEPNKDQCQREKKYFELTFGKPYKDTILNDYLPFVLSKAKQIKESDKAVKLYTRDYVYNMEDDDSGGKGGGYWGCINLDHPVTFDKLAMESELKHAIIEDLDRFVRRRDYYKKVGKAWKRGYLLYGPPGTGKSSLIAAMANYLRFDVYDLELTSLYDNQELRRILLCTTNRSIIVIEDIDCSAQMQDRSMEPEESSNTKLTLSGLLNFIDGLWSTCGDERIVIFTTNHKEKLDPALLRPGRMDMHIHMGYCTPEAFQVLALNYLGINDHPRLFPQIKGLIEEIEITPAEIAEHLMRNEDVDLALEGVVDLLKQKKEVKSEIVEEKSEMAEESDGVAQNVGIDGEGVVEKVKRRRFGRTVRTFVKFRRQLRKQEQKNGVNVSK